MFEVGTLVELNSGSCALTVVAVEDEVITVVWINDDGSQEAMSAPAACFQKYEQ